MFISMFILEKWLEPLHPQATIRQGDMTIESARFLSPGASPDDRFVYVRQESEPADEGESHSVVLSNCGDEIRLSDISPEEVFNRVLEAFEYYSALEERLSRAMRSIDPVQNFVELCQEQFGPTYIMDQRYHLIAISHCKTGGAFGDAWHELEQARFVPLDSFYERMDNEFYQRINEKVHNLVFESKHAAPYVRGVMNTFCDPSGEIIGQCMIGFDRPIEKIDLQMIDFFMSCLRKLDYQGQSDAGGRLSEAIFGMLLDGQDVPAEDMVKMHIQQRWSGKARFCIVAAEPKPEPKPEPKRGPSQKTVGAEMHRLLTNVQQTINASFPGSVTVIRKAQLISCMTIEGRFEADADAYIRKHLLPSKRDGRIRTGISYSFSDLCLARHYAQQAISALNWANTHSAPYGFIESCALDACFKSEDAEFKRLTLHPAIKILADHDRRSGLELSRTLLAFLRCERSFVTTAKMLNVHRNTVAYRIERIGELLPNLDLDDPDTREYLMYSFRLTATA